MLVEFTLKSSISPGNFGGKKVLPGGEEISRDKPLRRPIWGKKLAFRFFSSLLFILVSCLLYFALCLDGLS